VRSAEPMAIPRRWAPLDLGTTSPTTKLKRATVVLRVSRIGET